MLWHAQCINLAPSLLLPSFSFHSLQVSFCLHHKCSSFPQYSNTMYLASLQNYSSFKVVLVRFKNASSLNYIHTCCIFLSLKKYPTQFYQIENNSRILRIFSYLSETPQSFCAFRSFISVRRNGKESEGEREHQQQRSPVAAVHPRGPAGLPQPFSLQASVASSSCTAGHPEETRRHAR